jgi:hypothetical protein
VIEFHPHDGSSTRSKVGNCFPFEDFESFCNKNAISSYREPAFLDFEFFVGAPNSTFEFLKHDRHQYIAIPK